MKNLLKILMTIAVLLTSITLNTQAQGLVDVSNFAIMRTGQHTTTYAYLGSPKSVVLQALGNPTNTRKEYSEVDDQDVEIWSYSGNDLHFLNGVLDRADIVNNALAVGANVNTAFKIGDKATVSVTRVPMPLHPGQFLMQKTKSFYNYRLKQTPGKSTGVSYSMSSLSYLKNSKGDMDSSIEVLFDSNDSIIHIQLES